MKDFDAIITACCNNESKAQSVLYQMYSRTLFSLCLRYAHSREDAQDMLQDSFIKIFTNISLFDCNQNFESWAKKVTVNTALNHLRKKSEKYFDIEKADSIVTDYSSDIGTNDILILMNSLPHQKKIIFNMYEIEGFSHAEIAEMLDISESASRAQLSKAKEILRRIYSAVNDTKEIVYDKQN